MTARVPTLSAALAAGVCVLALSVSSPGAFYDEEATMKAIKKIAEAIAAKSPDAAKEIDALAKKASLDEVMLGFKLKDKGGFGVGARGPGVTEADGIEAAIKALAKKAPEASAVAKHAKELVEMTNRTQAIAAVADHFAPKEKKPGKDPADWKKWSKETKDGAAALGEAVSAKTPDPAAIQKAAKALNNTCTACHDAFR